MPPDASNVNFNNLFIWNEAPPVSYCMFERVMLCCLEFHSFRRLAGHMPAPMRRNPEAEQHLKLFVHCPSHPKAQKTAAQQPREARSSGTSQAGGLVSPHGWSLEIRNMHNSLVEVWFHLLLGEACTKATSLKAHDNSFLFVLFLVTDRITVAVEQHTKFCPFICMH